MNLTSPKSQEGKTPTNTKINFKAQAKLKLFKRLT